MSWFRFSSGDVIATNWEQLIFENHIDELKRDVRKTLKSRHRTKVFEFRFGEKHMSFLHLGAQTNDSEFIETLLKASVDWPKKKKDPNTKGDAPKYINTEDSSGRTPLYYAAKSGHLNAFNQLLAFDPEIKITQMDLHYFCERLEPDQDTLDTLLESDHVDINGMSPTNEERPLHCAINHTEEDPKLTLQMVRLLLSRGAKANLTNKRKDTPLHYAVYKNKHPLVIKELLLSDPALIHAKGREELDSLELAVKVGAAVVIPMLTIAHELVTLLREIPPENYHSGETFNDVASHLLAAEIDKKTFLSLSKEDFIHLGVRQAKNITNILAIQKKYTEVLPSARLLKKSSLSTKIFSESSSATERIISRRVSIFIDLQVEDDELQIPSSVPRVEDAMILYRIGGGQFGDVFKAQLGERTVALKALKSTTNTKNNGFLEEVKMLCQLDHPNCIKFLGVMEDPNKPYICMEFCDHGSLDTFLDLRRYLPVSQLLKASLDAAKGVAYLHSKNIIHRDLSCKNLLVSSVGEDGFIVKVADYGLSRQIVDNFYQSEGLSIPIRWSAPESITRAIFSPASDSWSIGVVLWEIFSYGRIPYYGMNNKEVGFEVVEKGYRLQKPLECPPALYELMQRCWSTEVPKRPSAQNIADELELFSADWKDDDSTVPIPAEFFEIATTEYYESANIS